jgi:hypothetical protein
MVIMALLPKAIDIDPSDREHRNASSEARVPLKIATPNHLPDAVAGRSYVVALSAVGGRGVLHWSSAGPIPEWLTLDAETGQLAGTPPQPTDEPLAVAVEVSDDTDAVAQPLSLTVLPSHAPDAPGAWWRPRLNRVDLGTWLEQGVGFLVLWLVHLLGMNLLVNLERNSLDGSHLEHAGEESQRLAQRRYAVYRLLVRLTTITAMAGLALWMVCARRA